MDRAQHSPGSRARRAAPRDFASLHPGHGLLYFRRTHTTYVSMKHIGFLSFGHWTQSPQSQEGLRGPKGRGRVSDLGGQRQGDQVAGPRLDYAAPNREITRREMARWAARRPGLSWTMARVNIALRSAARLVMVASVARGYSGHEPYVSPRRIGGCEPSSSRSFDACELGIGFRIFFAFSIFCCLVFPG